MGPTTSCTQPGYLRWYDHALPMAEAGEGVSAKLIDAGLHHAALAGWAAPGTMRRSSSASNANAYRLSDEFAFSQRETAA